MSRAGKVTLVLLFIVVFLSLGLNGFLLWQWLSFMHQLEGLEQMGRTALSQAVIDLGTFQQSTIQFEVQVNQSVPIQAEVPFRETLEVPIHTTIPIKQEVNTTVFIEIPDADLKLPIDITIPVELEVPIDLSVPVSIDRTIPISTTVPLDLNVPISIEISETELGGYVERLRMGLVSLVQALSGAEQ